MYLQVYATNSKGRTLGDVRKQVLKIIEEAQEIDEAVARDCSGDDFDLPVSSLPKRIRAHIIEEVIDCITACSTLINNFGFDEDEVQEITKFVVEKNRIRGIL